MTVAAKSLSPQCQRVLDYMGTWGDITSIQAWRTLGISRLGARIWELGHEHGYEIKSQMASVVDRRGEIRYVKRYRLAGK